MNKDGPITPVHLSTSTLSTCPPLSHGLLSGKKSSSQDGCTVRSGAAAPAAPAAACRRFHGTTGRAAGECGSVRVSAGQCGSVRVSAVAYLVLLAVVVVLLAVRQWFLHFPATHHTPGHPRDARHQSTRSPGHHSHRRRRRPPTESAATPEKGGVSREGQQWQQCGSSVAAVWRARGD